MTNEKSKDNEHERALAEYDAKWAGDFGITINKPSPVDENCTPACTEDFHLC